MQATQPLSYNTYAPYLKQTQEICSVSGQLIRNPKHKIVVEDIEGNRVAFDVYNYVIALLAQPTKSSIKDYSFTAGGREINTPGMYELPRTRQLIPVVFMESVWKFLGITPEKFKESWDRSKDSSGYSRIQYFAQFLSPEQQKDLQEHTTVPILEKKSCCTIL